MLVSAISTDRMGVYSISNNLPFYNTKNNEAIGDKAFNSLTPYARKVVSEDELPKVYDNINEWQNFCHNQITGGKLNIIA